MKIIIKRLIKLQFPIILVALFYIYFKNLTVDIYGGDVGDLVTAAYVAGVAHPPGYPLFTLLGFIATHIPFSLPIVTKVAMISLFSAIGSLIIFRKIIAEFVRDTFIQIVAVLILAFSYLFWIYTEIPEVFALNLLLSLCIVYGSIKFYKTGSIRFLYITAFIFGLGFANHHTIALLSPLPIVICTSKYKVLRKFKKRLLLIPMFFLLGTLPYLYVPLAASRNSILNWDDARNLPNFINLILRSDYGTFSAGNFPKAVFDGKILILKQYLITVISSISFPAFCISLIGAIVGFKKHRVITIGMLVVILISGPIFIFYSGFPIYDTFILGTAERFYLISSVLVLFFFPIGLFGIKTFFSSVFSKKLYATLLVSIFIIIPLLLFKANYLKTDLSLTHLGDNLAKDYFRNLPKNSVLIVEGDTKSFNAWYVHHVLGFRPDIELVQLGNIALTNKYFNSVVEKNKNKPNVNDFDKFTDAIKEISKTRNVYSTSPITLNKKEYVWVPSGLSVRLVNAIDKPTKDVFKSQVIKDFENIKIPERANLSLPERNLILSDIPTYYAEAFSRIGDYYFNNYADFVASYYYYKYSTVIDPQYSKGYVGKSRVENQLNKCNEAENDIKQAITYLPTEKTYYFFWYLTAVECFKEPARTKKIAKFYEELFHRNITDDLKKELKK